MANILENKKLIRQLGIAESMYDNEALNGSMWQSRAMLTRVKKEFDIEFELLNKAVEILINRHPLLQATIVRTLDEVSKKPRIMLPKYFVYMDKTVAEYNNIEMIETNDEDKWKEIIENELLTSFDNVNGPLWRIKVLKIVPKTKNDDEYNRYVFILSTSHAISDGKNGYTLLLQLLNILGALFENTVCKTRVTFFFKN